LKEASFLTQTSNNYRKKKREKKKQQRQAAESESSNILEFIYANLPADVEEVRKQADKQTSDAKEQKESQKEERKAADKKRREEEQQAKEKKVEDKQKKQQKRDEQTDEAEENKKKTTTKAFKTTDDEGFVTIDTEYVKKGDAGQVEKVKASDKLKSDIEKEKEDQKSKKKVAETLGSDVVLHNNPYAAVKKAGGLQSAQELQDKANKQKGAQRNADNNVNQQEKGVKSPPPPPPKQKQKKTTKIQIKPRLFRFWA